jgi:hypothetical protein
VAILLDRERLEASLPDPADARMALAVAEDVHGQQPVHEAAEISIGAHLKHEVEMVRHQRPAQDVHRDPPGGLNQEIRSLREHNRHRAGRARRRRTRGSK